MMQETNQPAIRRHATRWGTTALAAVVIAAASTAVGAPKSHSHAAKSSVSNASVAAGKKLYASQGCDACHKIGVKGGKIGPDLTKEATRKRSTQWLVAFFKNPKSKNPKTIMPPVKGSPKELADLAAYMQSLK
jgi:mono/diheme cytochrome c family protein